MQPDLTWPRAEVVTALGVTLEPLRVGHAAQVAAALGDPALHEFMGGRPGPGRRAPFTVCRSGGRCVAERAQGITKEVTFAMVSWLRAAGVDRVVAHVHPQNIASAHVARHIGLEPTEEFVEGETRWVSP